MEIVLNGLRFDTDRKEIWDNEPPEGRINVGIITEDPERLFYDNLIEAAKEEGRKEIREGIKRFLRVKEMY